MGLSKKLGGTTQKMGVPPSPVVPYKWSNQTYTVAEILKKFKLPCVVQCATDDSCTVVWSDFLFDLKQPLLLYSKRSVQKVHAVSLKQTNDVIEEIGPPLAIPADYEGWFGAAPNGISKVKRHFRIESIVDSTARRFLTTTKCPAFTTSHGHDGDLRYIPHDVMPGEILRRVCVLDSEPDDPDCPDLVRQHGPCLECLDDKDEAVVIPLQYSTLCYEVGDLYPDEESRVFQLHSLVEAGNTKLPRILNLIHGDPPLLDYAFTGMIRCYSVFSEETILAATLEDPGSRCLELITDSCVRFRLGLNEAAVKKTCEYTSAFQMCENFGAKFVTKIKVAFTLKPEVSEIGAVDVSTSESASDMQDVEANSEFDIRWGSVKKAKLHLAPSFPRLDSGNQIPKSTEPVMDTTAPVEIASRSDDASPVYSQIGETEMPQYRDFTEQEILKLMLRKGMMGSTSMVNEEDMEQESNEAHVEFKGNKAHPDTGSLHGNRVTDNPLFYFFQRHPEQNPWKPAEPTDEDPSESENEVSSDNCQAENVNLQNDHENPLGYLFTQHLVLTSSQAEAKNPLSYLFEPVSNHDLTDSETRMKGTPDKNTDNCSTSAYIQHDASSVDLVRSVRTSASSVETGGELHHYSQVARRTARVYSGSDDDVNDDDGDIEEEEEDCCSDSDDTSSSEMSEPSGIQKELYNKEDIHLPMTTNLTDSRYSQTRSHQDIETKGQNPRSSASDDANFASSDKRLHNSTTSTTLQINTGRALSDVGVYDEETEAVNDLFTLVDMESSKDSSAHDSENSQCSHSPDGSTSGSSESPQRYHVDSDSIQRLHTLLEEVSEIVSTSCDRILDSNKDLRNINPDDTAGTNTSTQSEGYCKPVTQTNNSTASVSGKPSILGNTRCSGSLPDEDFSQTTHPPEAHLDAIRFKSGDLNSRFHDRFNPELNMSKAESSTNVLQRSNKRGNVPQTEQERSNQSKSWKLHETKPHQTSLSSIFSVIRRQKTNSDLSKTNSPPEGHSCREIIEIDECENESTSPATSDSDRKYPFPYRNQRVLSLAPKNMASFENRYRLNSSNDSGSSNRSSSSLDNSFNHSDQSVSRLVVIGDYDLIVQDELHNCSGHDNDVIHGQQYNGHRYDPSSGEINAAGRTEKEHKTQERYTVSNSGKFRSNKLTCPQTNVINIDNEGEFLHEDYV